MNENEYTTVNERVYSNPELNVSESNQFLENLRSAQQQGVGRIATTTHALGTDVPSRMGGLGGVDTFVERYQTPQVESMVSNLRAAAQGQALSEQLGNILAQKQQEYKQAYRSAVKRKEDKEKAEKAAATAKGSVKTESNVEVAPSGVVVEGLALQKQQELFKQYLAQGMSPSEALKKATETWNTTYQQGSQYVSY